MTHILYGRMPPAYFRFAIDKTHIFLLMKMSYRWFLFLPRPPVPRGFSYFSFFFFHFLSYKVTYNGGNECCHD